MIDALEAARSAHVAALQQAARTCSDYRDAVRERRQALPIGDAAESGLQADAVTLTAEMMILAKWARSWGGT